MDTEQLPKVSEEAVFEAFKKLASRPSNFRWWLRKDGHGAWNLVGFKAESPKLICFTSRYETPYCTVYPDRIEYHVDEWGALKDNGVLLAIIQYIQEQADEFYKTHVEPLLFDPNKTKAPPGFCAGKEAN